MKNKKKKGFTLIELLAIIVILAIIAVITVPIILNIIENSRRGAATDSAYGYKDSVNKWYVSKLQEDNQYQLASSYTISSDGKLGDIVIPISGDKPSGGYLNYSNNTLTGGCLVFGDYAVTFDSKGNVSKTEKGDCPENSKMAVGDYVKLGDDGFYVINPNRNGNVVLMSEYNISDTSASTETGYNAPSNNGIMLMSNRTYLADNTTPTWRQDSSTNYSKLKFSESYYWENCVATSSEPTGCTTLYRNLYAGEEYGFVYDNSNNLYAPMQSYKTYLEGIIGTGKISIIRPMSYNEAKTLINNSYSWAYNQTYWLGSEYGVSRSVWYVDSFGFLSGHDCNSYYYNNIGVRPVIEISTSAF